MVFRHNICIFEVVNAISGFADITGKINENP